MLSHEQLLEMLHLDEVTGVFTWAKTANTRTARTGMIAGTIDKNGYTRIMIDGKGYFAHRLTRSRLIQSGAEMRDIADARDWAVAIVTASLVFGLVLIASAIAGALP